MSENITRMLTMVFKYVFIHTYVSVSRKLIICVNQQHYLDTEIEPFGLRLAAVNSAVNSANKCICTPLGDELIDQLRMERSETQRLKEINAKLQLLQTHRDFEEVGQ